MSNQKLMNFAKQYGRAALFVVSVLAILTNLAFMLSPTLRDALISFGEYLAKRKINAEIYKERLLSYSINFLIFFSIALILNIFFRQISSIAQYLYNSQKFLYAAIPVLAVLSCINALNFLCLPVAGTGFDPSWVWAVNKTVHLPNFVFGRDAVFTYGPLGFLFAPATYPAHIAFAMLANIICIAISAQFLMQKLKAFERKRQFIFIAQVFLFAPFAGIEWLWNLTVFILALNCLQKRHNKAVLADFALFSFFCAVSLVIKFNTAVFAGGTAFVLGLLFLFDNIKKALAYAAVFVVIYCAVTFANILVFFKNIHNFFLWFKMSLEVAGGYSSAMTINTGFPFTLKNYVLTLAALTAVAACFVFILKSYKQNRQLCSRLLLGIPVVFFCFKHGFVRQDGHMFAFFTAMPVLLTLIVVQEGDAHKKLRLFWGGVCVSSFLIIASGVLSWDGKSPIIKSYARNVYYAAMLPYNVIHFEERKKTALSADVLPQEWNGAIMDNSGANTIQILPCELSYAAANDYGGGGGVYNWIPNPVFQLYSVYTKTLDEYSAASFSPERAPDYILLEYNAIDGRNMFLDTPAVWNALAPNYHIVKSSDKLLLLKRNEIYKKITFEHIRTETYTWKEAFALPENSGNIYAKITIEPSALGKFITFVFRGNPSNITLTTKQGTDIYRVIADTLQTPVLLSRVPGNFEQMRVFFEGMNAISDAAGLPRGDFDVREIMFSNSLPFMHKPSINVEWMRGVAE